MVSLLKFSILLTVGALGSLDATAQVPAEELAPKSDQADVTILDQMKQFESQNFQTLGEPLTSETDVYLKQLRRETSTAQTSLITAPQEEEARTLEADELQKIRQSFKTVTSKKPKDVRYKPVLNIQLGDDNIKID